MPWIWFLAVSGVFQWDIASGAANRKVNKQEAANIAASHLPLLPDSEIRLKLLKVAESALVRGKVDDAMNALEKAAQMAHAADTEMLQVRAMMQAGNYGQATSFAAHTAGAHIDEGLAPTAMYAWLLTLGGQKDFAMRMLNDALNRDPGDRLANEVKHLMENEKSPVPAYLQKPPHRLAPYSIMVGKTSLPSSSAEVLANGVLWNGGREAIVPLLPSYRKSRLWIRNGLGQTVKATFIKQLPSTELSLLTLSNQLNMGPATWANGDPFPGSAGYVIDYPAVQQASPAWPRLHPGFLGGPTLKSSIRRLNINLPPGPRGGAIFDSTGKLAGISVTTEIGTESYLTVTQLREAIGLPNEKNTQHSSPGLSTGMEQVYESAMRAAVQLIVEPGGYRSSNSEIPTTEKK